MVGDNGREAGGGELPRAPHESEPEQCSADGRQGAECDIARTTHRGDSTELGQATAETGVSRGTRRETICETPSAPIVTP